jgi:hypothetical protein
MERDRAAKFWAKIEQGDGCWRWRGATANGYGHMTERGKTMLAHRLSWELHHGPIPKGMQVLHRCDTRRCVRPDHLFLGTHRENMADKVAKGRQLPAQACPAARLTADEVRLIRRLASEGMPVTAIARHVGSSHGNVSLIVHGKTWRHLETNLPTRQRHEGGPGAANGPRWFAGRSAVIRRSGGVCERCRRRPAEHVHHRLPARCFASPEDAHFPANLRHVCRACHREEHRELREAMPLFA